MKPYEMLAEKIMLRIKEGITPDLIGKAALDAIEEYANQQCELKDKQINDLKLAVTKTLELLEGNPTWTIDELHKYLKSLSE